MLSTLMLSVSHASGTNTLSTSCRQSQELSPVFHILNNLPLKTEPLKKWVEFDQNLSHAIEQSAGAILSLYHQNKWTDERALQNRACTDSFSSYNLSEQLIQSVSKLGLQQALSTFKGSTSTKLQRFAQYIGSTGSTPFRIYGLADQSETPDGKKGGFHRAQKSVFVNMEKIPPNEWFVILIHELSHSLNTVSDDAVKTYSTAPLALAIGKMAQKVNSPTELSQQELADLDRWLVAGLNRGFLSEVIVWASTLNLYEEGLHENLWSKVSWVEKILKHKKEKETLLDLTLRYLSPRFVNPTDGLFSRPLVQTRLKQIRREYLNGQRQIEMPAKLSELLK